MIVVEKLIFNPFQVNTYMVYDDTRECAIIDPGCSDNDEERELKEFIENLQLTPVVHLYTHCHVDHVMGMDFVYRTYGLKPIMHPESVKILNTVRGQSMMFGIKPVDIIMPDKMISEGQQITAGNFTLEVVYTPGHVDGHVCLVCHNGRFVISGDVLFNGSIGRTDLPTGDFDLLSHQIRTKLYTLPDDYTVYPGHGPETTIGYEKRYNPFVRGGMNY